jgi:hypothetical protein
MPTYNLRQNAPPPQMDSFPTLHLKRHPTRPTDCRAYLSALLEQRLGLTYDRQANLVPPAPGSDYWHLDLRPGAERRINRYADTRARIDCLPLVQYDSRILQSQLLGCALLRCHHQPGTR